MGRLGGVLVASCVVLALFWGILGRLGGVLAPSGGLGGVLGYLGGVLGCKINLRLFFVVFVTSFLIGFADYYLFSGVRRRTEMASTW